MSDAEDERLLAETASLMSESSKTQLTSLMEQLTNSPITQLEHMEGEIMKKRRKRAGWKKFRAETSDGGITYFRPQSKLLPVGSLPVCYVSPLQKFKEDEQADFFAGDIDITVKKYFYVFGPQRVDRISAATPEECQRWHATLAGAVTQALGGDAAYAEKTAQFDKFREALDAATKEANTNGLMVVAALAQTGFVNRTKDGLVYQGHLFFQKEKPDKGSTEGNYTIVSKKYFAYLYNNGQLVYTKHSKDPVPKGVISVVGSAVDYLTDRPDDDDSDEACSFTLKTRLHTFKLKARHRVALTEWVKAIGEAQTVAASGGNIAKTAISKVSAAKKAVTGGKVEPYGEGMVGALVYRLVPGKKDKVHTLSAGDTVAGRSSACQLQLDNKQVSRNHARFEYDSEGCRVLDLGSAHGTYVNGTKTNKAELKDGDEIFFGEPNKGQLITFQVRKKGMLSKLLGK